MAQTPSSTSAGETKSLPIITSKNGEPASSSSTWPEDRAPHGTAEERDMILAGLPDDSVAQSIDVPIPKLAHDFRLCCQWASINPVGKGPWGQRTWVGLGGGHWSALWGKGTIVPGGSDAQLMTENNTAISDTRYMLVTDDAEPAHIMVKTEGWRTGPPAVLERLLDPVEGAKVECKEYRVRLFVKLETGDERYRWLNEAMWIGSATRSGFEVIYDAYRLL